MAFEVMNRLLANADMSNNTTLENFSEMWTLMKKPGSSNRNQETILNVVKLRIASHKQENNENLQTILKQILLK